MATDFPGKVDSTNLPDIYSTDYEDTLGKEHDVMHSNVHDAVRALESKVGISNSGDPTSLDYIARNHSHAGKIVGAEVALASAQSIPNTTTTKITSWGTERWDTDGLYDLASPGRITIPAGKGGEYLILAEVEWAPNATGQRDLYLAINGTYTSGTEYFRTNAASTSGGVLNQAAIRKHLNDGDYLELGVYQSSTVALNIQPATTWLQVIALTTAQSPLGGSGARAGKTLANQLITNTTWTSITFDTDYWDTDGFHDTATNPSRFVIPPGKGGKYLIVGTAIFDVNATGRRLLGIFKNGLNFISQAEVTPVASPGQTNPSVMTVETLSPGDYVELLAYHSSGTNLNIMSNTQGGTIFQIIALETVQRQLPAGGTGVRAYRATSQSIPNNTTTAVNLDGETFDTDGYHDTVTNNTRFTVPAGKSGRYALSGQVSYALASTTGRATAYFRKNGTMITTGESTPNANVTTVTIEDVVDLVAGDYIELVVWHTNGAAVNLRGEDSAVGSTYMTMMALETVPQAMPLGKAVGTKLTHNIAMSIADTTNTILNFNTELWDSDGFHDTVTNNGRITIPAGKAGRYEFKASLEWAANATGRRMISIRKNGAVWLNFNQMNPSATGSTVMEVTAEDEAQVNDYYEVLVSQTSGAALNISGYSGAAGSSYSPFFYATAIQTVNYQAPAGGTGVKLRHSAAQSIPTATDTVLAFDTEVFDTDLFHDTVTNNSRITIPTGKGGKYSFEAGVAWQGNATGERYIYIRKNSGEKVLGMTRVGTNPVAAAQTFTQCVGIDNANPGDYYDVVVNQTSGGALNIFTSSDYTPVFSAMALETIETPRPLGQSSGARARNSTTQSVLTSSITFLATNTEVYDTDNLYTTALNTRFTVPKSGRYNVGAHANFQANATGFRQIGWRINGSSYVIVDTLMAAASAGNPTRIENLQTLELNAGDYIEPWVWQDSTITLTVVGEMWIEATQTYEIAAGGSGARVNRTTNQTITNNVETAISFSNERWDTDGYWNVAQPTRLTIPKTGRYTVGGAVRWASNATGYRQVLLRVNGTSYIGTKNDQAITAGVHYIQVTSTWEFSAGDYIELDVVQNSGGALDVQVQASDSPEFWIIAEETIQSTMALPVFAGVRVAKAAGVQSIANTTMTTISWDTVQFDSDGYWSSGAPTRFTIPPGRGGKHRLFYSFMFQPSAVGGREVNVFKNGVLINDVAETTGTSNYISVCADDVIDLQPGDYIEFQVYQSSGGALNLNSANPAYVYAGLEYIGKTAPPVGLPINPSALIDTITYTPVVNQGSNIAASYALGSYVRLGNMVTGNLIVNLNGAGTAGQPILITFPIPADASQLFTIGSFRLYDSGVAHYTGTAVVNNTNWIGLFRDNTGNYATTPTLAAGDVLSINFTYKVA